MMIKGTIHKRTGIKVQDNGYIVRKGKILCDGCFEFSSFVSRHPAMMQNLCSKCYENREIVCSALCEFGDHRLCDHNPIAVTFSDDRAIDGWPIA